MGLHHIRSKRLFAAVVAGLVLLSACTGSGAGETTTTTAPSTTTTTRATTTTTEAPPFIYRVGLAEAPTTDNFWAYYDPQSSLVDQYLLDPTKPSLYTYDYPGLDLAADLAADSEPPEPIQDDQGWMVSVDLKGDARWSDGEPITAADIVFTFDTVRSLGLARGWSSAYPVADDNRLGLEAVEAVDDDTVVFRYNAKPGLPFWPNGPGTAPIMPEHFWAPILEDALDTADPFTALLTASAAGEPSGGPIQIDVFGQARIEVTPNPNYQRQGEEVESGGARYEIGPFFDQMIVTVFPDQATATAALDAGDLDVILSPSGLDQDQVSFLTGNERVRTISNGTNGFRYLAFNLRSQPMASPGFRDAVAFMIDKEFMNLRVLDGAGSPVYSTLPPGNPRWFDPVIAEGFAEQYRGATTEQRLSAAVTALEEAGFTWEQRPAYIDNAVVPGAGVALEGEPVAPVRILAPGPDADPLRSTYALWVAEWITQLGFETDVTLTDFTTLVNRVFTPTPAGTLDFDIYILGWRLPSPAMPVYHESFFASRNDTLVNDGNNAPGFSDQRLDAFVDEYNRSTDPEDAYDILWEMEQIVFDEKPYIVLYDAPIAEAFREDTVVFPFTDTLAGIQFLNGMPALVRPVP